MSEKENCSQMQENEARRKETFVDKFLKPLILNAGLYVEDVRYEKQDGTETVFVKYRDGGEIKADVSCDSLIALTRDTLKNL